VTTGVRDNRGRFVRTLRGAERDSEACRLRASGYSYGEIAERLGYGNKSNAHRAVQTALDGTVREGADDLRELALVELDEMARAAWAVLHREHVMVSHGQIVRRNGESIPDDAPVLQAIDRLLKISERKSKYLGLDAPVRSRVETVTTDFLDEEIARLEAELAVHGTEGSDSD
jgi:hypothetical protein